MLRFIKVAVGATLGHLLHQMGGDAPVAHGVSNSSLANHVFVMFFCFIQQELSVRNGLS